MEGFYYITHSRDLRFARGRPTGGEVRHVWSFDSEASSSAALVRIAIEAVAFGCDIEQVERLMKLWKVGGEDLRDFARAAGIGYQPVRAQGRIRWEAFVERMPEGKPPQLRMGAGHTLLEALADLVKPGLYLSRNVSGRQAPRPNPDLVGAI